MFSMTKFQQSCFHLFLSNALFLGSHKLRGFHWARLALFSNDFDAVGICCRVCWWLWA